MNTTDLDWRTLSLADGGRSLIEASAGTGKTWTIAVLYLRLLLERGLSPRRIVVTTFTEAAAQELRERLRGKVQWAIAQSRVDARTDTRTDTRTDMQFLHARWCSDAQRAQDLQRLRLALAEMDAAPIGTLHSLCKRILSDHPFACGVAFALGELIDGEALLEEVADDLWRRLQQGDGHDELAQRMPKIGRAVFAKALKLCLAPGAVIEPSGSADDLADLRATQWVDRLRGFASLFRKNSKLPRAFVELADFLDASHKFPTPEMLAVLREAKALTGVLKAYERDPELHAAATFSAGCAPRIEAASERETLRFWSALGELARHEMRSRLHARHQLTFDDLLTRVGDALASERNTATRPLADALSTAWPVALVDEFQDTDGVQYGILDAIYRDAAGGKRGRLVMIGDPKQAIYRFRGGDIHAYEQAAAVADERMTLNVNQRSSRALVDAFNQFYEVGGKALSARDGAIEYRPVEASDRRDDQAYVIDGKVCTQPLQIHHWPNPPEAMPDRRARALSACASQIAALLRSKRHALGTDLVRPSDIAVLLPTGKDIEFLRDRLRERGVPCVTSSRTSVFATDVARELQVVLYAVLHHADLGALRAAAATRLCGASFRQLQQWGDDVASWQPVTRRFRALHAIWHTQGAQRVVEDLIRDGESATPSGSLAARYLDTLGGERVLTDLRHLGELLQEQSEVLSGAEELLAWFGECRAAGIAALNEIEAADAAQVRIESDSARVRLMTLHASKGLEFPIVFLPLMWAHGEAKDSGTGLRLVNDARTQQRRVEVSKAAEQREKLDLQDERFRVLYVALTRAIHACHVYALPPPRPARAGASPAQGTARSALDVMLGRLQPALGSTALEIATSCVGWIDGWPASTMQRFAAEETRDQAPRRARTLPPRSREPLEARHSFTALTHGPRQDHIDPEASAGDESDADGPDGGIDTAIAVASEPHALLQELAAVRGTDFGNAVHAIFERRVVGVAIADQRELVEQCLDTCGVRRRDLDQDVLIDALTRRIDAALCAPLRPDGMRLADLPAADLRTEMEFHFVLDRVSMPALREACARHGDPALVPRSTRTLSGLMNGKIDLIFRADGRFHVLDYKSNYLGDSLAGYQGDALSATMDANHYRFQALLYSVALDRYLRQRLADQYTRRLHLGECFYVFVRAAGIAPGAGIWRHRFSDELLDAVAEVFGARPRAEVAA